MQTNKEAPRATASAKASRAAKWSLQPYLGRRLVVLHKGDSLQSAARAMESNNIGAVLIEDEGKIVGLVTDRDLALRALGYEGEWAPRRLQDLITRPVESVTESASLAEILDVMILFKIRRVPVIDAQGHIKGLVTLDDLVAEGVLTPEQLSEVIWAQLAKPERALRGSHAEKPPSAAKRRSAHILQGMIPLLDHVANCAGLTTRAKAEEALLAVTEMLVQRITPEQANAFLSQLPRRIAEHLESLTLGPDTSIGAEALLAQVSRALEVPEERAVEITQAVFEALEGAVTGSLLSHVFHQLPHDIKKLLKPAQAHQ